MMKKRFLSLGLSLLTALSLVLTPALALNTDQAKQLLSTYYVDGLPAELLELDDLDAILAQLGDPYTVYMSREEYEAFLGGVNGSDVVGIGVSIRNAVVEDSLLILSVLPDSPALEAGLEAGDRIVAIDGDPITSIAQKEAITGPEGTQVTLSVLRQATGTVEEFTLSRRKVRIPIVTGYTSGDTLVIDCTSFGESTADTIAQLLRDYGQTGRPILLDLRSNPGGTAQAATTSAGYFVGGALLTYFRDSGDNYSYYFTGPSFPDLTDDPLIVLTSSYSASGSELFSAAIRDLGAGIAVGERTYGKGIAQLIFDESTHPDYFDGDALKITVYRFFSPNGATNDVVGVLPTLLVPSEYAQQVALLLSSPQPENSDGYLKLLLAGREFYVDLEQGMRPENQAALELLLESLPPLLSALWEGSDGGWVRLASTTPEQIARRLGLPYEARDGFSDLGASPYADEIRALAVYGLVSGYEDGTFRPTFSITRGEFAAMMASALNLRQAESAGFSDVPDSAWYAGAVNAMAAKGFLSGCGDGAFRPDDPISCQEILVSLSAASAWACMEGYDLAGQDLPLSQWGDYSQLASWAQSPAWRLEQLGLDLERERSAPQAEATRGQAAHLLYQFLSCTGLFWTAQK